MVTTLINSTAVGAVLLIVCVGAVLAREVQRTRGQGTRRSLRTLAALAWVTAALMALVTLARFATVAA